MVTCALRYNTRHHARRRAREEQMASGEVQVRIDDRVRLIGALLAASRYPDMAQARKKHGLHAYARATRKRLAGLANQPAVKALNRMLDEITLELLFMTAMNLDPVTLELRPETRSVRPRDTVVNDWLDFAERAHLRALWQEQAEAWERSAAEAERALGDAALRTFLSGYLGPITQPLVFVPNISFPADRELGLVSPDALLAVVPPRAAWGDSPPWPFDEDPAYVLGAAVSAFSHALLWTALGAQMLQLKALIDMQLPVSAALRKHYPTETGQFMAVMSAGLVAIYFEDHLGAQEADAWMLMEKRQRGLDILPAAVQVLRAYRAGPKAGTPEASKKLLHTFAAQVRERTEK
jgi:hypothetical protein